ncbi:hypothetical protein AWB74_07907 [Caballeronia arvi]|uniref:Uncharacterized protein n=1 Tax=Caballeronia arvi TaxID=1777135 RepID=A0A158L1V8_9BURK|nr:hypothetical protein AWB74_07907 [Caballeronia arvi]
MTRLATPKQGSEGPLSSKRKNARDASISAASEKSKKKAGKKRPTLVEVTSVGTQLKGKERVRKEKVVRDSFTMPRTDYEKVAALKQKCLDAGVHVNKSELLRAGLLLLEAASKEDLYAVVSAVERIKTGRPPKSR